MTVLTALCALFLAACSPALPPVPPLSFDGLAEPVAAQWREALDAVEASPDEGAANAHLAMVLHAYAQFPEADVMYQRARALSPDNATLPWYHGLLLRRLGEEAAALDSLAHAVTLDPDNPAPALQLALSASTPDPVALLEGVLRVSPGEGRAYLALGQQLIDRGDTENAVDVLSTGIERAGNFGALHYALATALRGTGASEADIDRQLDLHRRHQDARLDVDDELPAAVRALDLSHAVPAGNERLHRAVTELEAQRAERPQDGSVHANLMAVHGRLLNFDAAADDYAQALRYLPDDPSLHFAAGNIALLANRNHQALIAFERCLATAPDFDEARVQLGQANERLGRDAIAVEEYRAVLARVPAHPVAAALLARRLVLLDQFEDPLLGSVVTDEDALHGWQWRLRAAQLRAAGDVPGALAMARRGLVLSKTSRDHETSEMLRLDIEALLAIEK
ncbi:MAG: tetratricopeptide repeat protein [Pseudomonadota bacterium]